MHTSKRQKEPRRRIAACLAQSLSVVGRAVVIRTAVDTGFPSGSEQFVAKRHDQRRRNMLLVQGTDTKR